MFRYYCDDKSATISNQSTEDTDQNQMDIHSSSSITMHSLYSFNDFLRMEESQLKIKVFTNTFSSIARIDIDKDSFFQIKKIKLKDDYEVLQIYEVSNTMRFQILHG